MVECPGVVVHTGPGSTYLGSDENNDMITSDFLVHVADLLSRAGLSTQVRNDVDAVVWQKISVNAALNTLTTILRYATLFCRASLSLSLSLSLSFSSEVRPHGDCAPA
jgi:ketopantoate reductase